MAGRLAKPDAVDLLKAELHDEAEAEALRTELNTLFAELDNIGVERADGLLTGGQAKIATDRINEKLASIERRQHDQERLRVFDGLPLGKPEVADALASLSPDRFRAVLDVLADDHGVAGRQGRARVQPRTGAGGVAVIDDQTSTRHWWAQLIAAADDHDRGNPQRLPAP